VTSPAPNRRRNTKPKPGRSLDPQGKRALFETPVSAARDTIQPGRTKEGKAALFSTGPHERGSVVVACSACEARSRISVADVAVRLTMGSIWFPLRRHSHWMSCPACGRRTWCEVRWTG
jgi:hypothetical protein